MNNPNPFVPKGSLLEQQSLRRSRLKIGVFCVLTLSITGLVAMLIQGCKREAPPADNSMAMDNTNSSAMMDNPGTPVADTNVPPYIPPVPPPATNTAVVPLPLPVEPAAGSEYAVVKSDTLSKIAKAHGVSLKELQAANPTADSRRLKIGQKLTIPAATKSAEAAPTAVTGAADASAGDTYTVKNNDTLTKIAKNHGVSIKALKAANNLKTDHIKVGQKLKIPGKAEAAPAADSVPPLMAPPTAPVK